MSDIRWFGDDDEDLAAFPYQMSRTQWILSLWQTKMEFEYIDDQEPEYRWRRAYGNGSGVPGFSSDPTLEEFVNLVPTQKRRRR